MQYSKLVMLITVIGMVSAAGAQSGKELSGTDTWGGRKALPTVVNPVVRSSLQEVISMRGGWEFVTDSQSVGIEAGWVRPGTAWPGLRKIEVPGCWETQGVGKPGISQPWDMNDRAPYPLRHIYMGTAWYRRVVSIPAAWSGKRVWLKIGGVRSQGWFWVNGKPVAYVNNYCGIDKYDITDLVVPGHEALVAVQVRNDVPSRKGMASWRHRSGGLIRDVELEATPDMRIDNAWVEGDFDEQCAKVHATVAYATEAVRLKNPILRVKIGMANEEVFRKDTKMQSVVVFAEGQQTAEVIVRVPLNPFNAWSPKQPNLYLAEITLFDGNTPVHGWTERFGVRKLEVREDRFFLNNQPFFVRGYGDDGIYPLTLISPASKEEHLKRLMIARATGFNYARLHTHCELPEFYEAADEAGILVQAELPYNHAQPGEAFPSDPKSDLTELITHYQRYVSLATCCMGNEGGFPAPLDRELYQTAKSLNPRLLVLHHDGGNNTSENSDFRSGPTGPWIPAHTRVTNDLPYIAHEYLNLTVRADPRLDSRFTGAYLTSLASLTSLGLGDAEMKKVRAEFPLHILDIDCASRDEKSIMAELERVCLTRAWGDACQDGAHALQRCYQKQGLESARLDVNCDGYSFWTIIDVLYQAQGLFNVFWEPKPGGATPEEFRMFNGPTAILKRDGSQTPVAVSGQTLTHTWWISHYNEEPLQKTKLTWTWSTEKKLLTSGSLDLEGIAVGDLREIGPSVFVVPPLAHPVHAVLEAKIEGHNVTNRWDYWLFPQRASQDGAQMAATRQLFAVLSRRFPGLVCAGTPEGDSAKVLIAADGDPEVLPALEAGRRVVLLDRCKAPDNVRLGWWLFSNQTGTAMARHPVFGDFPHDGLLSPLWFRLVKRPELLQPDDGFCGAEPLMVGEGIYGYSLYLCQAQVGKGALIRSCGLDMLTDTPEGNALLDSIFKYARSDAFVPQATLDPALLKARWQRHQQIFGGLNGWGRTLKADANPMFHCYFGSARTSVMRLPQGKQELEWETLPYAKNGAGSTITFRWMQVTSVNVWKARIARPITLTLNGKTCLTYTGDVIRKEWTEQKEGVTLSYSAWDLTQNSNFGLMELTVLQAWVEAGKPSVIRLTPERSDAIELSTGIVEVNTATFQSLPAPNGWRRTISAGDSWHNKLPSGVAQIDFARAMKGKNELIWETQPVLKDAREKPQYMVEWRGGMGYFVEPQGSFALFMNDEKVIDIPTISETNAVWISADKTMTLAYERDPATAEYGTLTLTLPSSKVTPGKPLILKVVASDSNSRRWFGVFETW